MVVCETTRCCLSVALTKLPGWKSTSGQGRLWTDALIKVKDVENSRAGQKVEGVSREGWKGGLFDQTVGFQKFQYLNLIRQTLESPPTRHVRQIGYLKVLSPRKVRWILRAPTCMATVGGALSAVVRTPGWFRETDFEDLSHSLGALDVGQLSWFVCFQ